VKSEGSTWIALSKAYRDVGTHSDTLIVRSARVAVPPVVSAISRNYACPARSLKKTNLSTKPPIKQLPDIRAGDPRSYLSDLEQLVLLPALQGQDLKEVFFLIHISGVISVCPIYRGRVFTTESVP
jgi:hypothetical protein